MLVIVQGPRGKELYPSGRARSVSTDFPFVGLTPSFLLGASPSSFRVKLSSVPLSLESLLSPLPFDPVYHGYVGVPRTTLCPRLPRPRESLSRLRPSVFPLLLTLCFWSPSPVYLSLST